MKISTPTIATWVSQENVTEMEKGPGRGASEGPKISIQIQKLLVLSDLESNEHQSDLS